MFHDKIFLLSIEEYKKYAPKIPECRDWWGLRSPGYGSYYAAFVNYDGSVGNIGCSVSNDLLGVRPALRISALKSCPETDEFEFGGAKWRKIGDGLAIAIMPLFKSRFDEKSNDYETSEVRGKLLKWWIKNATTVYTAMEAPLKKELTAARITEKYSLELFRCVLTDERYLRRLRKIDPRTGTLGKPERPGEYLFFETDADAHTYAPLMAEQKLRETIKDACEGWGISVQEVMS